MAEAPAGKTCRICGEDCSNKPRTKDQAGRYYCRECHDAALAKKRSARSAPPRQMDPRVFAPTEPDAFALSEDVFAQGGPPPARMAAACPGCGSRLDAGVMICVNCGYNTQTHAQIGTKTMKAPKASAPGGGAWPVTIGVISIVLGGFGILLYGGNALLRLIGFASAGGPAIGAIIGALLGVGIWVGQAIWLLNAGIGVMRRRGQAVASIRRWAVVKIILALLCVGAPTALIAAVGSSSSFQRGFERSAPEFAGTPMGIIIVILICMTVWMLVWPILVLVWFGRPKVQADVSSWK